MSSEVLEGRAAYCADRAKEHRSAANAYRTTRNVLFGVTLLGTGMSLASVGADVAADGDLGNDTLSTTAVISASTAVVALLGAFLAGGQVSSSDDDADRSITGATRLLAWSEQHVSTESGEEEAESEYVLPLGPSAKLTTLLEEVHAKQAALEKTAAEENEARRTLEIARASDTPAVQQAGRTLGDAQKKTAAARAEFTLAQNRFLSAKHHERDVALQESQNTESNAGELSDDEAFALCVGRSSGTEDAEWPDRAKPDTAKPDTAKPDTAKPDTAKPDTAKPDTAKPDTAKPDTAKSDTAKPDTVKQ